MADETTTALPTSPDAAKIEDAREVRDEVNKALDDGTLTRTTKAFKDCNPGTDVARTIAADEKKHARFYARSVNTADSSLSFSYFYDAHSRLRWVTIGGAGEQGSLIESNIAFDPSGARVLEENKTLAGPAFKFPGKWDDKDVRLLSPTRLFSAPNACGPADAGAKPKPKPKRVPRSKTTPASTETPPAPKK